MGNKPEFKTTRMRCSNKISGDAKSGEDEGSSPERSVATKSYGGERERRENEEKAAQIGKQKRPDVGEQRRDLHGLRWLRWLRSFGLFGLFGLFVGFGRRRRRRSVWFGVRGDCLLEKTSANGSNSAPRIHETALRAG